MITPRIPYTQITLSGLVTLADRTLKAVNKRHPDDPLLARGKQSLEAAKSKATGAVNSSTGLQGTKDVTAFDDNRDSSFDSLKNHVKAGLKRNNPVYRAACERLYAIFEKNNLTLAQLPYDEESGALKSLFEDLSTPQAIADLATIHATDWLEELKTDQAGFETAVLARSKEKAAQDTLTDAEASALLVSALKSLYRTLDVAEENELIAKVTPTIKQLNALIAEIVTAHRR